MTLDPATVALQEAYQQITSVDDTKRHIDEIMALPNSRNIQGDVRDELLSNLQHLLRQAGRPLSTFPYMLDQSQMSSAPLVQIANDAARVATAIGSMRSSAKEIFDAAYETARNQ